MFIKRLIAVSAVALAIVMVAPRADAAEGTIVAFGDSLAAGYGLPAEDAFPVRLEAYLRERGHDWRVVNAGVSGDTSAGGLARLDWALADEPDLVILELGSNDGLRGLSAEAMEENLDRILARLDAAGIKVLLAGMRAPPNLGPDYAEGFEAVYPRLAEKYGVPFYPFFLDGVAAVPALNQPDGIHPNEAGVAEIVRRIGPLVERVIAAGTQQEEAGP